MKLEEFAKKLGMKIIVSGDLKREIKGLYVCDLLSHVMGKAKADFGWITVQTNINIVAVAQLTDVSCIIIPEDIKLEEDTAEKAIEQDITILSSESSAVEIISEFKGL